MPILKPILTGKKLCKYGAIEATLDKEDRRLMDSVTYANGSMILKNAGFVVSDHTIRRHQIKECPCPRPEVG
jgi:hypothetical protein